MELNDTLVLHVLILLSRPDLTLATQENVSVTLLDLELFDELDDLFNPVLAELPEGFLLDEDVDGVPPALQAVSDDIAHGVRLMSVLGILVIFLKGLLVDDDLVSQE